MDNGCWPKVITTYKALLPISNYQLLITNYSLPIALWRESH